jgi:hypothetical protein
MYRSSYFNFDGNIFGFIFVLKIWFSITIIVPARRVDEL